jgi:hypothetical protein
VQRRAHRRRLLWIATGLLALTALAIAAWPARPRHRANAVVHVGISRQQPATASFDNSTVMRADGVTALIRQISSHPRLDVDVHATADTGAAARKRVRDAADLVHAAAVAVVPTPGDEVQARADAAATATVVDNERARLQDAQNALAKWRSAKGDADPAQQLGAVNAELAAAVRAGRQADIAALQQQQFELSSAETTYSELQAAVTAAQNGVSTAMRASDDARFRLSGTGAVAKAAVAVGPVTTRQLAAERPFGRLAVGGLLLIFVIIAADTLFLTRTRLVSPYVRETTRERHRRHQAERRARAEERAAELPSPKPPPKPKAKPPPKSKPPAQPKQAQPQAQRRRRRVEAKPLDLPNIEVHLMDKEGGLRAVELRDAAQEPEGGHAQQP